MKQQIKREITAASYKKGERDKNVYSFLQNARGRPNFEAMGIKPPFKWPLSFPNRSRSNPAVFLVFENRIKRWARHTLR